MYTIKVYVDTLVVRLSLIPFVLMWHTNMIIDENNFGKYDEKFISCKCNYNIVAKMIKGAKYL